MKILKEEDILDSKKTKKNSGLVVFFLVVKDLIGTILPSSHLLLS